VPAESIAMTVRQVMVKDDVITREAGIFKSGR
jgi:hypothetical protein